MDQFYSSLSAFKIVELDDNLWKENKETIFKATKKTENEPKESNDINEIEANFVRKLKKGFGKYIGKSPFKCFNHGRIGHYASRCTCKEDYVIRDLMLITREMTL